MDRILRSKRWSLDRNIGVGVFNESCIRRNVYCIMVGRLIPGECRQKIGWWWWWWWRGRWWAWGSGKGSVYRMVSWNLDVVLGWMHGDRMVQLGWWRDKKCIWRSVIHRIKRFVLELRFVDIERRVLIERILIDSFDRPRVKCLKKHRVAQRVRKMGIRPRTIHADGQFRLIFVIWR